ncbi:MAG TPA: MlaD family protein [Burkholderiaceae bacterium]|nr:MlaD family protein [Burkholderiaceae bacterium]
MEPRAHHVLIGIFTLVACTAMVVFSLWLSRAHQQGRVDHYRVTFQEAVRGLAKGSAVLYNGIRIGEVDDMHLDTADLRQAHVRIAIDADIPIRTDTQARLVMTGVTGASVIELSGGSPLSPLLAESYKGDGDPEILAVPSPLSALLAGGDNLVTNISELAMNANNLVSSENIRHVSRILAHVDTFTGTMADSSQDLADVVSQIAALSNTLSGAADKAGRLMDSAGKLVSEQGSAVLEQAGKALSSLEDTSASLAELIRNSEESVVSGTRGLNELGPVLQALRRTLQSVQEVVRKLDDNPGAYLFGGDSIQEFEP